MSSKQWVEQLPPTASIQDPAVRAYLDAFTNAWQLRNGNIGHDDRERFITKGEFEKLAGDAYRGYISGAIGGVPGGPPTAPPPGDLGGIATSIVNSALYQMLGARIPDIRPPYELLNEIDNALATAMRGVVINKNNITRVTKISEGNVTDIRALNTSMGQYDSLIFDAVLTEVGRAARIESMKSKFGSIEAAITNINTVTADSTSAIARALHAMTATMGLSVRTFFNEADANGNPVYRDTGPNSTTPDAMRTPRSTDQWFSPTAFGGQPAYTRRIWNGGRWQVSSLVNVSAPFAGIAHEADARVAKDTANAQAINNMWAAVTGSMANIQDGAITFASGQEGTFAQRWTTLQTDVYEADPNNPGNVIARVTKLRQDLITGQPLKEDPPGSGNYVPDYDRLGFLGVQDHDEILEGAYALRLESNGTVGGFGLTASRQGNRSVPGSDINPATGKPYKTKLAFGVRADTFWIASPDDKNLTDTPPSPDSVPFIVVTEADGRDINGRHYPQGTWMNAAFITEASIGSLQLNGVATIVPLVGTGSYLTCTTSPQSFCQISYSAPTNPRFCPKKVLLQGAVFFAADDGSDANDVRVSISSNYGGDLAFFAASVLDGFSISVPAMAAEDLVPGRHYVWTLSVWKGSNVINVNARNGVLTAIATRGNEDS